MVDPVASLLPHPVPVNHLGMFRRRGASSKLEAVEYYNNLSDHHNSSSAAADEAAGPVELAIIVDPIIATGVTCLGAVDSLREYGARKIVVLSVLCAEEGVRAVAESADNVEVWV
jgi:uracil phosphoribosyltransferase